MRMIVRVVMRMRMGMIVSMIMRMFLGMIMMMLVHISSPRLFLREVSLFTREFYSITSAGVSQICGCIFRTLASQIYTCFFKGRGKPNLHLLFSKAVL